MNENNYAFAVAKIRALENKLVQYNQIERIIDAPDAKAFYDALSDSAYSKHFDQEHDYTKFQQILDQELIESKKLLTSIAPDANQLDWVWLKYDFINLKYIIKNHLASPDQEIKTDKLVPIGKYQINQFIDYITNKQKGSLDDEIITIIDKTISEFQNNHDPKEIDFSLDKKYFSYLLKEISKLDSRLIKKLIRQKIDLYNLKLIFRIKELDFTKEQITKLLVTGGTIKKEILIKNLDKSLDDFVQQPSFKDYDYILKNSLDYYKQSKSFLVLEKLIHEYFVESLRHAKYLAFGIEPLVAYWLAKDNEVKILRIIMTGKINNIEKKIIHEQIHKLYTQK